jgi:hypothetical protein
LLEDVIVTRRTPGVFKLRENICAANRKLLIIPSLWVAKSLGFLQILAMFNLFRVSGFTRMNKIIIIYGSKKVFRVIPVTISYSVYITMCAERSWRR